MTPEVIVHHPVPNELSVTLEELGYSVIEVAASTTRYARIANRELNGSERIYGPDRARAKAGLSPETEGEGCRPGLDTDRRHHPRHVNGPSKDDIVEKPATPASQVRLVSIELAAYLLGIGRTTVYDLINRGELRSTKVGRRTLLVVEDIDAFVNRKLASA